MKTCGYCGNEYDDKEPKCPVCGSTMLRYTKGAETAEEKRQQLAEEIKGTRRNRSLILGISAAVVFLVVVMIISSIVGFFTDPQRAIARESKNQLKQAEQMIDAGDYDAAIALLDQISTEWEDYSKTESVRQEAERGLLMEQINAYQTAGNYEELVKFIDVNISSPSADAEIQPIYEEAAQKCKENVLAVITTYTDAEDYLGAIEYIDCLGAFMKNDADIQAVYNQAVASYKAEVLNTAENYALAGDYSSARSTLSVAENYIGSDADIAAKITEINEREVTAKVLSYVDAGNYKDAILCLNENSAVVSGSADLQAKLSAYTEKYRTSVINDAASEYKENGYEAAVSVLNSALKVLPNDATINSEKVKYEAAVPVALTDLDVTKQGKYFYVGKDKFAQYNSVLYGNLGELFKDVSGNSYSSDGVHYITHFRLSDEGTEHRSITYFLNQDYDVLTGTLYRPYVTLHCGFTWQKDGTVKIYGDGVLLYTGSISYTSYDAVDFKVNITGVRELQIEMGDIWWDDAWDNNYRMPKVCVADLKVAKAP